MSEGWDVLKFLDTRHLPYGSFQPIIPSVKEHTFGWMCLHGAELGEWTGIQMEIDWAKVKEADLGELELVIRLHHTQGPLVYQATETCHEKGTLFVDYEIQAEQAGDATYYFSFVSRTNSAVVHGPIVIRGYIEQS
ncbi:hypothetical protein NQ117_09050 [Paenibacillus sp. SC116]|nr:hypothetical protein [Paenibacillus sp. SC116]